MAEGLPVVRAGAHAQLGMPKWAERVWPYEEGMQGPEWWKREEEFANQHVRTNIDREIAMWQTIESLREAPLQSNNIIAAYDIRIKEIYTAHRKAIRAIKDMYPGVR
jgi:hypothetical protein